MATLANQTISSTYDGLIKTSTDQPVPISGVQLLEDGVGNSLALSVGRANQGVTVTGTLSATSISGVLADGVTATTQTLGDNSTKVATTAYVDAQVTASDLDFAGDTGTGAVDLDSQTFTIAGTANEIETAASGQTVTIGLPSSVTVGTLNATTLGGTLSTAAQPNITSVGTLSSLAVTGNIRSNNGNIELVDSNKRITVDGSDIRIWQRSSANIQFLTNDLERMRIDSSGRVSINDTVSGSVATNYNPELLVGGNIVARSLTANEALIEIGGDATSAFITAGKQDGSQTARPLRFEVGTSEAMRIDSSGNVGIGTSSPTEKVQITMSNSGQLSFLEAGASSTAVKSSGSLVFEANPLSNFIFQGFDVGAGATERMRIDSNGRVGIGTSSPSKKLDVVGDVVATSFGGRVYPFNSILGVGADASTSTVFAGSTSGYASSIDVAGGGATNPNTIIFKTASTERMRIDSSGNLLMGLTSSTYTAANRTAIVANGTNQALLGLVVGGVNKGYFYSEGTNIILMSEDASGYMSFGTNNAERMRITSAGAVFMPYLTGSSGYNDLAYNTANGQLIYRTSSLRYKENVQDLPSALDKVNNLRTVTYDEKETGRSYFGLIAEELYEHIPELVTMREIEGFDEPQPDGITYSMLSVYLLKAIQEQQEIINDLKARIETLETK